MRVSTFALLTTLAVSNAKLRSIDSQRTLIRDKTEKRREDKKRDERDPFKRLQERPMLFDINPEKVGELHNEAFEKLSNKYSERLPESEFDLMSNVGEVMASSFCPNQDSFCDSFVYKTTMDEFYSGNTGNNQEIKYPEGFNKDIKELLTVTESTIVNMNADNFEEVINELTVVMDDLQSMENVPSDQQAMAIASVSVAKGSSELWFNAYTDPNHKMHGAMTEKVNKVAHEMNRRRRLDETEAVIVVEIEGRYWDGILQLIVGSVLADYFGMIRGGLTVLELIPKSPNLLWPWNWPGAMLSVALFHSIPASARFALGSNQTAVFPHDIDL